MDETEQNKTNYNRGWWTPLAGSILIIASSDLNGTFVIWLESTYISLYLGKHLSQEHNLAAVTTALLFHEFIQKNHIRYSSDHYLHEDLHAIANVIFGSVKIILQDVKETKLLAIIHFYNCFLLFCLHCLINESQQSLVVFPIKQQLQLTAYYIGQVCLLQNENIIFISRNRILDDLFIICGRYILYI